MSILSRDAILGLDDRPVESVSVPEWGGLVLVRGISGTERDQYEIGLVNPRPDGTQRVDLRNIRARLVVLACVDAEGNRIFRDDDIDGVGAKSAQALERVFEVARRLSGLSESDVQELAEGFGDAPSAPSTSA